MTTIGLPHQRDETLPRHAGSASAAQQLLLVAGVLCALLYLTADLVSASRYPGYSIRDQAISELSAIGAPTKGLWASMMVAYQILFFFFAVGVLRAAKGNRALRITGALLLALGLIGVLWTFFPMHQRGDEFNWSDVGHIIMSAVTVLLTLSYIAVGAFALGPRFRLYSFATLVAVVGAGALTFAWAPRISANEPTPWLGLVERVIIYGYLLWLAVLAVALLRRSRHREIVPA